MTDCGMPNSWALGKSNMMTRMTAAKGAALPECIGPEPAETGDRKRKVVVARSAQGILTAVAGQGIDLGNQILRMLRGHELFPLFGEVAVDFKGDRQMGDDKDIRYFFGNCLREKCLYVHRVSPFQMGRFSCSVSVTGFIFQTSRS